MGYDLGLNEVWVIVIRIIGLILWVVGSWGYVRGVVGFEFDYGV